MPIFGSSIQNIDAASPSLLTTTFRSSRTPHRSIVHQQAPMARPSSIFLIVMDADGMCQFLNKLPCPSHRATKLPSLPPLVLSRAPALVLFRTASFDHGLVGIDSSNTWRPQAW